MARGLAGPRPYEVCCVGLLELGFAGLREAEPLLRSLPPPEVCRDGGYEIQVVRMKPEDAQQSREAREVTVDHSLQVGNPPMTPRIELLRSEQVHLDEHIDRSHDLALRQHRCHCALDPRVQRIAPEGSRAH